MSEKVITPKMLADIDWIYRTLMTFEVANGHAPSKFLTKEVVGRSLEFAKGAFWARETAIKEKLELVNKFSTILAKTRLELADIKRSVGAPFDA